MPRTKKYDEVRDEMLQNPKVKEEYDKLEQEYTEEDLKTKNQENLNEVVQETVEEKEEIEKAEAPGEIITDTPIEEATDLIKDEVPTQEEINEIANDLAEHQDEFEEEIEVKIKDTSNERLTSTYGFGVKFKE